MDRDTLQSFLDRGTTFEGKISFSGTVRIDGRFKGQVHSQGTLVIGEAAEVEAQLELTSAVIHGKLNGAVTATDLIEIGSTAQIEGSLKTRRLQIAEGARVNAKIEMDTRGHGAKPGKPGPTGGS